MADHHAPAISLSQFAPDRQNKCIGVFFFETITTFKAVSVAHPRPWSLKVGAAGGYIVLVLKSFCNFVVILTHSCKTNTDKNAIDIFLDFSRDNKAPVSRLTKITV